MKTERIITATTVGDAYQKANELYGSLGDEMTIEVLANEKKGFLGIGSVPAQIKVILDDGKEEPKTEVKKENKPSNQNQNQNNRKNNKNFKPKATKETEVQREPVKEEDIHVSKAEKQIVIDFLNQFIKNIDKEYVATGDMTEQANGDVSRIVTIEGEGASELIGHHGETLDALQYLANLCLARKSEGEHKEYVKVIVDIENYRAKREEALRALARRMGEKAIKQQRNVVLEPMNPYERRIIHSEIQKMDGLSTHSVGTDEHRKVVIAVAK